MPPNSEPLELTVDFVVKRGYQVFLDGCGNTVELVGNNRFNVELGGKLCLFNMHIVPHNEAVHQPFFCFLSYEFQIMPQLGLTWASIFAEDSPNSGTR